MVIEAFLGNHGYPGVGDFEIFGRNFPGISCVFRDIGGERDGESGDLSLTALEDGMI